MNILGSLQGLWNLIAGSRAKVSALLTLAVVALYCLGIIDVKVFAAIYTAMMSLGLWFLRDAIK